MAKKIWFGLLAAAFIATTLGQNSTRPVNIFIIAESENSLAEKSVRNAVSNLRSQNIGWLNEPMVELINASDATGSITTICNAWNKKLTSDHDNMPDLVLDVTRRGYGAEMVHVFTAAMGVPTLSAQFGQYGDLRGWKDLTDEQKNYSVQIMPPADIVPQVIRQLAIQMNISNAAIIFDSDFTMDHKYKSLLLNVPTRHVIIKAKNTKEDTLKMLGQLRDLDIVNYFVLSDGPALRDILDAAEVKNFTGNKYGWYAFTMSEDITPQCGCHNISVLFFKPKVSTSNQQQLSELGTRGVMITPFLMSSFYYDLVRVGVGAMRLAVEKNLWPATKAPEYVRCKLNATEETPVHKLNLLELLKSTTSDPSFQPTFAEFNWQQENGYHFMKFDMDITMEIIKDGNSISSGQIGTWEGGIDSPLQLGDNTSIVAQHTAITSFRVVTVELAPFMMLDKETGEWSGYCIDLMEEIQKILDFQYEIYVAPDNEFGNMDDNGNWDGMIKELMDKKADIALGTLSVMAERENVVDFTVPYYDLVGISILMLKAKQPTSLFKFLTVLEDDVWLCILGSYFFTSFLMWIFDRWSPYSYQNNKDKYKDDEEKREFDLKECLWFCMTSLTPQGGGEAPKNLSGRLVAATWWLFGFIIIASYTANLAAFLTVSRLETPIESLDDLSKQYKIQYAPVQPSEAYTYFKRMANIETKFYEIWKDMSLNDSLSDVDRAALAVWDYPVSDRYTKMFEAMKESGFPVDRDEAVKRVRKQLQNHSSTEFAFIGDATAIRYLEMTTCDLLMVGDEFSRKPYAIAVQQGSPLKDQFNNAILQLLNKRKLESLKNKWWNQNPKRRHCKKEDDQSDGISIANIGGVFIVIFVGIFLACATLAFEYWWFRYRPQQEAKRLAALGNQNIKPMRFHLKPARPAFNPGSGFRSRF